MRFRFGTDIGLKREENQDAVRCEYFGHNVLAVVCDGMGGERAGKEASALAIEEFFQRFSADYKESLSDEDIRKLLISSISAANSVIYTRARFDFKNFGMGTTCVAAFVNKKTAFIANVGDSRAYLIGDSRIDQLTNDHSMVQMMLAKGEISPEEAKNHPKKNIITRAVGAEKTVICDYNIALKPDNAALLICTDGLSNTVTDEEIFSVVHDLPPEESIDKLIELANAAGGPDNITAVLIK